MRPTGLARRAPAGSRSSMFRWNVSRQIPNAGESTASTTSRAWSMVLMQAGLEAVERLDGQPHAALAGRDRPAAAGPRPAGRSCPDARSRPRARSDRRARTSVQPRPWSRQPPIARYTPRGRPAWTVSSPGRWSSDLGQSTSPHTSSPPGQAGPARRPRGPGPSRRSARSATRGRRTPSPRLARRDRPGLVVQGGRPHPRADADREGGGGWSVAHRPNFVIALRRPRSGHATARDASALEEGPAQVVGLAGDARQRRRTRRRPGGCTPPGAHRRAASGRSRSRPRGRAGRRRTAGPGRAGRRGRSRARTSSRGAGCGCARSPGCAGWPAGCGRPAGWSCPPGPSRSPGTSSSRPWPIGAPVRLVRPMMPSCSDRAVRSQRSTNMRMMRTTAYEPTDRPGRLVVARADPHELVHERRLGGRRVGRAVLEAEQVARRRVTGDGLARRGARSPPSASAGAARRGRPSAGSAGRGWPRPGRPSRSGRAGRRGDRSGSSTSLGKTGISVSWRGRRSPSP